MTAAIILAACNKDETEDMAPAPSPTPLPQEKNIVETAQSLPQFSILVDAVVKAGLADALSADGPFTVFAPTNDAFNMLFDQLGVNGVEDLTAEQLTPILLYHVVGAKVMAADVKSGSVPTLNPDANIEIEVSDMGVKLNGKSNVITTDVMCTNGVIHVIDAVILP